MIAVVYIWDLKPGVTPLLKALRHQVADRRELRSDPSIGFYKLLGTGAGKTFTPGDANLHRWALIVTINPDELDRFDESENIRAWRSISENEVRIQANRIASHGAWSGSDPFESIQASSAGPRSRNKVLAITRARLVTSKSLTFWRAVPAVTTSLLNSPGLEFAIGIGEAPVGLQGTLSIWSDSKSLKDFAYSGAAHQRAIADTTEVGWYSEELFARFEIVDIRGQVRE